MIRVLVGDIFESSMTTLVNTVNCVGVMGKGIAQVVKKKYPRMFEDYVSRCKSGRVRLGEPYYYSDLAGTSIVNFPTKGHWRSTTRLSDVESGLNHFLHHAHDWKIESVAFPPLGCGNGGLDWKQVGPLMYSKLGVLRIPVEVYAPFGTPSSQLTDDFLGSNQQIGILEKGRQRGSLRPEWAILVEILHEMERQPYAKSVGRKMFKWICYIMTSLGLDTGFGTTRRGSALLSIDVQEAIDILANHNWILEKRSGQGTVLVVGPAYVEDRIRFKDSIASFARKISMTVDLCSRIKSMSQAEQIATVISSVRVLKKTSKSMDVSEQDLFNYIRESGKPRMESEVEQCELVDTIRNLEMLGWVRLRFSESLEMARARTDSGEPVAGQHTIL